MIFHFLVTGSTGFLARQTVKQLLPRSKMTMVVFLPANYDMQAQEQMGVALNAHWKHSDVVGVGKHVLEDSGI